MPSLKHVRRTVAFVLVFSPLGAPTAPSQLQVNTAHTMATPGARLTFEIRPVEPAGVLPVSLRVAGTAPDGASWEEEIQTGGARSARWQWRVPPQAQPGVYRFSFSTASKGSNAVETVYVDVVEPAVYRQFAAAANAVRLKLPQHLIFVGDSLTALFRGYNYVDKVRGWLQYRFGNQVTVTNAGAGGDFTTRVLSRLDADVVAQKPTHVFLFLGHNDSKLKSVTGYREAVVPPDRYEQEYRQIIQTIQQKTGARVTVISATSSVYEITKATAEKAAAAGKAHNLFGKPEVLEQYNAIAKRVAQELGAGYLDVYEPTRTHPNKPALFTADGVHLSNEGNRLVALEILRYLALCN